MTLWMKGRHYKHKKCFSHVLEDYARTPGVVAELRFSLIIEHQLFMGFHHSLPHLGLGKMYPLPGHCVQNVGSYLTLKPLFVAELLFAPSAAQKLWHKDSPVQSSVYPVEYLPP